MILTQQLIDYLNMYLKDPQILILLGLSRGRAERTISSKVGGSFEKRGGSFRGGERNGHRNIEEGGILGEGLISLIRTIIIIDDKITTMGLI